MLGMVRRGWSASTVYQGCITNDMAEFKSGACPNTVTLCMYLNVSQSKSLSVVYGALFNVIFT